MKFFRNFLSNNQSTASVSENNLPGNKNENTDSTILSDEEYKQKGRKCLYDSLEILNSSDGWKLEKQTSEGDTIHSKYLPGVGKLFKLTAELDMPVKTAMDVLVLKPEHLTKWNPAIIESRIIKKIDDFTELAYQVTSSYCGGLVSSREFVNVKYREFKDGSCLSCGTPISHPEAPSHAKYIRAENGPNCWVIKPVAGNADRCVFNWMQNTKFNGWLPQYAIDSAQTSALLDYATNIRVYVKKLEEQNNLSHS